MFSIKLNFIRKSLILKKKEFTIWYTGKNVNLFQKKIKEIFSLLEKKPKIEIINFNMKINNKKINLFNKIEIENLLKDILKKINTYLK